MKGLEEWETWVVNFGVDDVIYILRCGGLW